MCIYAVCINTDVWASRIQIAPSSCYLELHGLVCLRQASRFTMPSTDHNDHRQSLRTSPVPWFLSTTAMRKPTLIGYYTTVEECCTLFSVGAPFPRNKWGILFNTRQDVTSKAACKYNRTSTSSSYLSRS